MSIPSLIIYLVATNTSGFESFRRKLFILVGHEMDAERELVNAGLLAAQIEDPDLGIGDTSTEARLGVRLVLTVTVASGWSTPHLESR